MLFNSVEYIFLFLPLVFFVYFYLSSRRLAIASKSWLVFASLFFYSWWNIFYLPLILSSILFNFTLANILIKYSLMQKKALFYRKSIFVFSVVVNILFLAYFKYMDFFILNINYIFLTHIDELNIVLPLAISFFTLQQIAYLVDVYNGKVKELNLLSYMLFVVFFPQLIAGPIVHHKEMMPQFNNVHNKILKYKNIALGIFIFSMGLFKKIVIADTFAVWATNGFDNMEILSFFEAWITSLSYSFQLYFDFSGYADMAIGVALLFNIKLPKNFDSPYRSTSIREFWRRWHITLSSFLRDYVYIPLGGNRKSAILTYINLFVTFLIAGLWHGASWMFVIFGSLHGLGLVVNRYFIKFEIKIPKIIGWFITFNFVNIAFIFFRAVTLEDALKVLEGMVGLTTLKLPMFLEPYFSSVSQLHLEFGYYYDLSFQATDVIWFLFAIVLLLGKNLNSVSFSDIGNKKGLLILLLVSFINVAFLFYIDRTFEFLYFQF